MRLNERLRVMLEVLPPGGSVTLTHDTIKSLLESDPAEVRPIEKASGTEQTTWRERIWTAPAETRLSADEVAEALGKPSAFVYRRTGEKSRYARLPHRRLDGGLVFVAGEIRRWMEDQEEVIHSAQR